MNKEIVSFIKISSLKLKEEITDLYIYQDNVSGLYSVFYNDEIKCPINLEKAFYKKYKKIKNFFEFVKDIKIEFSIKEDLIKIVYYI